MSSPRYLSLGAGHRYPSLIEILESERLKSLQTKPTMIDLGKLVVTAEKPNNSLIIYDEL
jgi:hypothetical protein